MGRVRSSDGASAVEFAIVLPLLVLFLFGIIAFGLAFARAQGMEATAREAARLAAVARTVTEADVTKAAQDATSPLVNGNHIEVEIADDASGGAWCQQAGDRVRVTVRIADKYLSDYALIIPLWPGESSPDFESYGVFNCEARRTVP